MWTDATLVVIDDNDQYTGPDGTTYPWNFPKNEIPGLVPVTITPRPDDSTNVVRGFSIDSSNTQVWDFTPMSADDLAIIRKRSIQSQIDELERNTLENRGSRELHLREMEREAAAEAAALSTPNNPVSAAQILASVPYYSKLKGLDDQIAALRAQL